MHAGVRAKKQWTCCQNDSARHGQTLHGLVLAARTHLDNKKTWGPFIRHCLKLIEADYQKYYRAADDDAEALKNCSQDVPDGGGAGIGVDAPGNIDSDDSGHLTCW